MLRRSERHPSLQPSQGTNIASRISKKGASLKLDALKKPMVFGAAT
jgi:hypothetical protein